MATNFGGVSCDYIAAEVREPAQRVHTYEQPGQDGVGAHKLGLGNSRVTFRLRHYGTFAEIETWIGQINALLGTKVSVEDDRGVTYTNVYPERRSQARHQAAYIPGSSVQERCEMYVSGKKE